MLISTKGRYALRVMLELAARSGGEFIALGSIAESQGISLKYLESIISVLSKAGLVVCFRGKGGGYRLTRAPKDYRVGPGLDVNPARGHDGALFSDPSFGGVVLFEKERGPVEGATATAVFLDPADVAGCRVETDALGCRILTLKKKSFTYWAGAAWSRAGQITNFDQWLTVVRKFRAQLEEERK